MARKKRLEQELAELDAIIASPAGEERVGRLRAALGSRHGVVAARAAHAAREGRLTELEESLVEAYARFLIDPVKADPGCHAKVAILEALDHLERLDPDPFVSATSYKQMEKAWGPPDDTAIGVRSRGALALVRMRYGDVLPVLGRLLGDPEARVRGAAAQALGHHGDRNGAALLLLRVGAGEDDPEVLSECVRALCELAPDLAGEVVSPMLADDGLRELAAHAIVAANRDEAIALLIDAVNRCVRSEERSVLLTALGVSRRSIARELLLGFVAEGNQRDAEVSVRALGVHSYDPRVAEAVREAALQNEDVDLERALVETFSS